MRGMIADNQKLGMLFINIFETIAFYLQANIELEDKILQIDRPQKSKYDTGEINLTCKQRQML